MNPVVDIVEIIVIGVVDELRLDDKGVLGAGVKLHPFSRLENVPENQIIDHLIHNAVCQIQLPFVNVFDADIRSAEFAQASCVHPYLPVPCVRVQFFHMGIPVEILLDELLFEFLGGIQGQPCSGSKPGVLPELHPHGVLNLYFFCVDAEHVVENVGFYARFLIIRSFVTHDRLLAIFQF